MSGRVYLLGLGVALAALALALTDWALSLQPGVTERNVRRVRPGMTLEEVDAILGGQVRLPGLQVNGESFPCQWVGAEGTAHVRFGWFDVWEQPTLKVRDATFERATARANPFSRLRAWLGW
jgi:hypothetical protein